MIGPREIIIILIIALLLFGGRGRISALMGDIAKGIKSFRKGLQEEDDKTLEKRSEAATDVTPAKEEEKTE